MTSSESDADNALPPRSPKGAARRQQILDRAIEVFATHGDAGTSLRAIAEAIGVSHGALLHYFHSRETLLIEVLRENDRRDDGAPAEDQIVGPMVKAAARNVTIPGLVALYTSMLAGSIDSPQSPSNEYFTARFERVRCELVERIRDGQNDGILRSDVDANAMAALIVAASDGLQTQWLLDTRVDIAQSLRLLSSILET